MIALFMAGGSGTRLWPLSRESSPKQFHALVTDRSLIVQTVERVLPLIPLQDIWIVTGERYLGLIADHLPGVLRTQVIGEPFPLGTNLAVGLGAIHIAREHPEAVMLVGWADSHIANTTEFLSALRVAEEAASKADGVILGVRPTYAATGYGYIKMGGAIDESGSVFRLDRFEEKPDAALAANYLEAGKYLWNTGISIWRVSTLLDLMSRYKPAHYAALKRVQESIGQPNEKSVIEEAFRDLEKEAIDTAIFEKAERMATIPVDLGWSDVGSWAELYKVLSPAGENVTRGPIVTIDTEGCLIYGRDRVIGTIGISDLVIVDTEDALLVARREDTERLKDLYTKIKQSGFDKNL